MMLRDLCVQTEDQERLNLLLQEIGTIIARNNDHGLELDFDHWATVIFSPITGYNQSEEDVETEVPQIFIDAFNNGK